MLVFTSLTQIQVITLASKGLLLSFQPCFHRVITNTNTNTRQYSIFNLLPSLVSRHHRQGCQKSLNHKPLKRQNINGTDDTRSNFVPKIITRQTRTFVMSMSAGLGLLRAKLVSALSIVAIVLFTGLLYFL